MESKRIFSFPGLGHDVYQGSSQRGLAGLGISSICCHYRTDKLITGWSVSRSILRLPQVINDRPGGRVTRIKLRANKFAPTNAAQRHEATRESPLAFYRIKGLQDCISPKWRCLIRNLASATAARFNVLRKFPDPRTRACAETQGGPTVRHPRAAQQLCPFFPK